MRRLLFALLSILSATHLHAARYYWGNTGTDFNTAANWTTGIAPIPGDVAWFTSAESKQPNLSVTLSIAGIYFYGTTSKSYDLTNSPGTTLTLTGYNSTGSSLATDNTFAAAIRSEITSGTNTIDVPITLAPASGNTSAFYQAANGILAVNGAISGSGIVLSLPGTGTYQLTGTNTYSGGTTVPGGATLAIGNNSALGTGTLTISSTPTALSKISSIGGARSINNAVTLSRSLTIVGSNDLTFTGKTSLWLATSTISASNSANTTFGAIDLSSSATAGYLYINNTGNITINGIIANGGTATSGSLTYAGTGVLTLSAANTFTGATSVTAGTLQVNTDGALGTTDAGTTVSSGAALKLNGVSYATAEGLTLNGTGVSGGGALVNSGTSTYAGQITAATNASINAGGGTLNLSGGFVKDGTVLTLTGGGTINVSNTGISGSSANSDLVVDGTTVNLNVSSTYNGPTYVRNGGTFNANAANALPTANGRGAVTLDDSGTGSSTLGLGASQSAASLTGASSSTVSLGSYALTIGSDAGGSTIFAGSISGTGGSLVKDGASTQTLSGTNAYTGGTTIGGGTITANNASALGTGIVTVNSNGTLNITGVAIANAVTLNSGTLTGTGSLTGTGANALSGSGTIGSSFTVAEFNFTLTDLTTYNALTLIGGATLNLGALNLSFAANMAPSQGNLFWNSSQSWNVVTGGSGSLVLGTALDSDSSGYSNGTFSLSNAGTNLALNWTSNTSAVPEPSTYAVIFGAVAFAVATWRRRQHKTG
jgi:fibronectin-binding autotransporter adhesin